MSGEGVERGEAALRESCNEPSEFLIAKSISEWRPGLVMERRWKPGAKVGEGRKMQASACQGACCHKGRDTRLRRQMKAYEVALSAPCRLWKCVLLGARS